MPRQKITKEMIIEAGFMIVREEGEDKLNVRSVASLIGCSTQPIMYCYPTVKEMKSDILERTNEFHTSYLIQNRAETDDIMIGIGMNYIRFAHNEKNLFRFIVMSDKTQSGGISELFSSDDAGGISELIARQKGLTPEQARDVFEALFISFHGYAAFISQDALRYDEIHCKKQLVRIYDGVVARIRSELPAMM